MVKLSKYTLSERNYMVCIIARAVWVLEVRTSLSAVRYTPLTCALAKVGMIKYTIRP